MSECVCESMCVGVWECICVWKVCVCENIVCECMCVIENVCVCESVLWVGG